MSFKEFAVLGDDILSLTNQYRIIDGFALDMSMVAIIKQYIRDKELNSPLTLEGSKENPIKKNNEENMR